MAAAVFRAALLVLACAACTSVAADSQTFEGSRWHVAAIDGTPTPASGDYHVQFEDGQISGRFGCNGWGGSYLVRGQTLTASQVRSTMMACAEPPMSFEGKGMRVLGEPMHWSFDSGRRLKLMNSAGSLELTLDH